MCRDGIRDQSAEAGAEPGNGGERIRQSPSHSDWSWLGMINNNNNNNNNNII